MKPWTISQLKMAMLDDLAMCHTDFERSIVKAIAGKEIRDLAYQLASIRKLNPCEVAIASEFGYNKQS